MAMILYHSFVFFALFSYGIYHLISAIRSHLKPQSSRPTDYAARPYYPLAIASHRHHLLRHLPLYLCIAALSISFAHLSFSHSGPHRLPSLSSAAALLFFLLILLAAAALSPTFLPSDLLFLLVALAFAFLSSSSYRFAASYPISDLQSKTSSVSALIAAASAVAALSLAVSPKLFISELFLAASVSLQGLWSLQSGLSLYADSFIPEGCHWLLDVPDSPTRCDLEDMRVRAAGILDLAFVFHCLFVAVMVVVVFAAVTRSSGGLARRNNAGGSYEALPTSSSATGLTEIDHLQMKTIAKNSMQA